MTLADPRQANYQLGKAGLFILVGSQRSGTNFFREVMNTHPQMAVHGEILWPYPLPNVWHNYVRHLVSRAMPPILDSDATALVDDYFVHLDDDTKRGYPDKAKDLAMVGVDIKYNQLRFIAPLIQDLMEAPFLLRYCHNRRVRIVHMYRRNVLHQALSLAIADHRNVYHNYQGRKFEGQVTIPAKKVTESCYWIREQRDLFRQLSKDLTVLEVAYEDVAQACESAGSGKPLAQKSAVMQQIADFLQLPNKFTSPTSIAKVINRPFKEILANHAEVLAAVKRSEFAEFATTM